MRALQAIGIGLVVVLVRAGSPDLLPDPLGWLLILHGVRRLPSELPLHGVATALGALALVVSLPLSVPALAMRVLEADQSLRWAVNLPQLLFVIIFATALGQRAAEQGDSAARGWWFLVATLTGFATVAPVLVFGGGITVLETPGLVIAGAVLLTAVILCFVHAGRGWANPQAPQNPQRTQQGRPS